MNYYYDTFITPTGVFSVAINESSEVVATAFGDLSALKSRIKAKEHFIAHSKRTAHVRQQVQDYFNGKLTQFDLKLGSEGTEFQQLVWDELRKIPFGKTASYGEIANRIHRPKASRAVGRANGTNPICLIVPCHRVIGANGSLTGFAFGESIKKQLLDHEARSK